MSNVPNVCKFWIFSHVHTVNIEIIFDKPLNSGVCKSATRSFAHASTAAHYGPSSLGNQTQIPLYHLKRTKQKAKKKILTKTAYANVSHSPLRSTGHLLLSLPCSSPCPVSYRLFESSGECRKSDIIETEGRHIVTHSYRWRLWRTDSISAGEDGSGTFLSPLNFFYFLFFFFAEARSIIAV